MRILSIETSCDETSVAVVEKIDDLNVQVLSHVTATSLSLHAKSGGVIPENAARMQVEYIIPTINSALQKASYNSNPLDFLKHQIDAIAVTYGPGLIGSLLVGVETAKTLSFALQKPLIPVNHLLGHIYANFITNESSPFTLSPFPFIGLIVSGGHTDLLYFKNHNDYKWLGGTRDDAAGECFDKCARLLGYSYPGGPKISELAISGNPKNVLLPKLMVGSDLDFSFSGLKTAFVNFVKKEFETSNSQKNQGYTWMEANINNLSTDKLQLVYDLCASLEYTIVEVLVRKTLMAANMYNVENILLGGGVSANTLLTKTFRTNSNNKKIFVPEKEFTTDNGAMIGAYAALNPSPVELGLVIANPGLYFA